MSATRADVVACARTWIGTTFEHQQRMKGVGVDCVGLVIGVARELGLIGPSVDVHGYPRVPDGRLLKQCDEHMRRVSREAMQPGDVIAVTFDVEPMHLGIVGDYVHGGLSMIHALAQAGRHRGRVCEMRLMFSERMRFMAAYSLPGVD
jgi:cell wall-associated NlpC family hydrolase